jgi:hypothetical protein
MFFEIGPRPGKKMQSGEWVAQSRPSAMKTADEKSDDSSEIHPEKLDSI